MNKYVQWCLITSATILLSNIVGCSSGDDSNIVKGQVPVVFAKRQAVSMSNPLEPVTDAFDDTLGDAELIYQPQSSPSSEQVVYTDIVPSPHDVSDPEVNYDGKSVFFSMRIGNGSWNVWQLYFNVEDAPVDLANATDIPNKLYHSNGGVMKRVIDDDAIAEAGDDIDPVPTAGGFIVFASDRQQFTQGVTQAMNPNGNSFKQLDEYERRSVTALHVMNPNNQSANASDFIEQISFNASHDRDVTVTSDGTLLFSRWEHVGPQNRFTLFSTNADGTSMFVQFGQFSGANSKLYPREIVNSDGSSTGKVAVAGMSLTGTDEGGRIDFINFRDYAESNVASPSAVGPAITQPANFQNVPTSPNQTTEGARISAEDLRLATPYVLFDGTNRMLYSQSPIPDLQSSTGLTTELKYQIMMYDLDTNQVRPVTESPDDGFVYIDAVPVMARVAPNRSKVSPKISNSTVSLDGETQELLNNNLGVLTVKTVYDTDDFQLMGNRRLGASGDPQIPLANGVADIATLKNPSNRSASQLPVRFMRVIQSVPSMRGLSRMAVGDTNYEMQRILGYTQIHNDGSVKMTVPAGVGLAITALDVEGRAIQIHRNWIQVTPGEKRTCNGCHSPRLGSSIYNRSVSPGLFVQNSNDHPNVDPAMSVDGIKNALGEVPAPAGTSNETMAETYVNYLKTQVQANQRDSVAGVTLTPNIEFNDIWAPPANKEASFAITYDGLIQVLTDAGISAQIISQLQNGYVNFPDHIQPIFESATKYELDTTGQIIGNSPRPSCVSCHSIAGGPNASGALAGGLDLSGTTSGTGRLASYTFLVSERIKLDASGNPLDARPLVVQANNSLGGSRAGGSRQSYFFEVMYGQELMAPESLATNMTNDPVTTWNPNALPSPPYPNGHRDLLNKSELRVLVEFADLGRQYYNYPWDENGATRTAPASLSAAFFGSTLGPKLETQCMSCHGAGSGRQFVMVPTNTGNPVADERAQEGNFNMAASFVSDVSAADNNLLYRYPANLVTIPDPANPVNSIPAHDLVDANGVLVDMANWITGNTP